MFPTADETRQQELLIPILDLSPQLSSLISNSISSAISSGRNTVILPVSSVDCDLVCRHLRLRGYKIEQVQVSVINPTLENFITFSW